MKNDEPTVRFMVSLGFRGTLFSNFARVRVSLDGEWYPTVEHAYQAAKTLDRRERGIVQAAETPGRAKRLGRTLTIRSDWEEVKLDVMWGLLGQKFAPGTPFADVLKATAPVAELVEWNTWGDRFWGRDTHTQEGENHLGRMLMQIRAALLAGERRLPGKYVR